MGARTQKLAVRIKKREKNPMVLLTGRLLVLIWGLFCHFLLAPPQAGGLLLVGWLPQQCSVGTSVNSDIKEQYNLKKKTKNKKLRLLRRARTLGIVETYGNKQTRTVPLGSA